MSSVMRITSKQVVLSIEQNRKHAARATQLERQVEKRTYTYDTELIETGKQTRNELGGNRGYYW